jgi:hypothetical protein
MERLPAGRTLEDFKSTNWFIAASWIIHKDNYKEEMEGVLLKYGSILVEEALNWGYLKILFARREQHELSLRYWCKQIWSIIITFLWQQSSSTRSRLFGSVIVHSIHLQTPDLHSFWRCIQPTAWSHLNTTSLQQSSNIISGKFAAKIRGKQWRVVSKFEES